MDYSCIKIGIIMEFNLKINEEIKVSKIGKSFDVDVVEFEDQYWFPFKFD